MIRASGLFAWAWDENIEDCRRTVLQSCWVVFGNLHFGLLSSFYFSMVGLHCVAQQFLESIVLYCVWGGYWQNAFLRSFVDFAYIVWLHCTMFTLFISSARGDSSTGKCCKGGWLRLQFALSWSWTMNNNMIPSFSCPSVFSVFVAFSWMCATKTFRQDHFFQSHVFQVLFSWMCVRGCWVNAWRKWLSLQHKARVSFAIAVTCNILLHYVACIFLLHTWTQWLSFRASSIAILFSALPNSSTTWYISGVLQIAFFILLFQVSKCFAFCVLPSQRWRCWCSMNVQSNLVQSNLRRKSKWLCNLNTIPTLNMLTIIGDLLLWKPGTFFDWGCENIQTVPRHQSVCDFYIWGVGYSSWMQLPICLSYVQGKGWYYQSHELLKFRHFSHPSGATCVRMMEKSEFWHSDALQLVWEGDALVAVVVVVVLLLLLQLLLPQVLHRLQNKEKPMQNNFYSPFRVTQNDFRVQHCKVWCGTG